MLCWGVTFWACMSNAIILLQRSDFKIQRFVTILYQNGLKWIFLHFYLIKKNLSSFLQDDKNLWAKRKLRLCKIQHWARGEALGGHGDKGCDGLDARGEGFPEPPGGAQGQQQCLPGVKVVAVCSPAVLSWWPALCGAGTAPLSTHFTWVFLWFSDLPYDSGLFQNLTNALIFFSLLQQVSVSDSCPIICGL